MDRFRGILPWFFSKSFDFKFQIEVTIREPTEILVEGDNRFFW
jgi:hypothetical protein